jgi:hypothetical protein
MTRLRFQFLMLAAFAAACGGSDSTGPGNNSAAFTANIDGVAWQADQTGLVVSSGGAATPGSVIISGTQLESTTSYRSISLLLGFITGPGTYPLGVNLGTSGGGAGQVLVVNGTTSTSYITPFSGNAGTIQITSLGSNIAGTFSFVAPPTLGGGASKTVTNGSFDVTLPANFVAATTAGRGSTLSATLGGTAWNAATVVGIGPASSFGVSAATDAYTLTMTPLTPIAAGSYSIGTQVQILVIQSGTGSGWGYSGSTGTVTFTAVGPRVTGTFSGTLVDGTGGSLVITNGTFDVKLP